ncbi:sulfatase-like hydrolase/transferase [soil metagenome]
MIKFFLSKKNTQLFKKLLQNLCSGILSLTNYFKTLLSENLENSNMKTNSLSSFFTGKFFIQAICSFVISFFLLLQGCNKDFKTNLVSSAEGEELLAGNKTKNILILFSDDVGYEVPTCDGGQSYATPNIDLLAAGGKRFTRCYASPKCSPSRQMLLTGQYSFRNYTDWGHMSTDNKTFANMFKDAGFATCYSGKWQLDGGDYAIHTFGFDKYAVWQPFNVSAEDEGNRYKGASIYQDGSYLPEPVTRNKYSEDEFATYLLRFIDSADNLNKPFFAFYSMINCHSPFQPTPDDPEYDTWDTTKSDKKFFPSMVKYHDKKIGEIIAHMDSAGLLENTMIFYFGDNGTNAQIVSQFNDFSVKGGKATTTEPGTNVPLIVYQRGKITAGTTSDALIDFTDFFPTLSKIAGLGRITGYGIKDGVSFDQAILSDNDSIRSTIYDSYSTDPAKKPFIRWAQNAQYKLYDTVAGTPQLGQFVKIEQGKTDSAPLPDSVLTRQEKQLKKNMLKVLRKYNP